MESVHKIILLKFYKHLNYYQIIYKINILFKTLNLYAYIYKIK